MNFLIVSGMSGAGKSRAAVVLEDLGYYSVENLPAQILPELVQFCMANHGEYDKVAMLTDVRSGLTAESYVQTLKRIDELGCSYSTLFLDADTQTIIKRYKETRREHPLQKDYKTLQDAVEAERQQLAPIRALANEIIDTSAMPRTGLQDARIATYGSGKTAGEMTVTIMSFGYKYGIPLDADLVIDVRMLPNPYYVEELRHKTGEDREVAEYVFSFPQAQTLMDRLEELLKCMLPLCAEAGRSGVSVCIGCTGGHHRSVAVSVELGKRLTENGYHTVVHHRDMRQE
jgi:UPF0042 nucleotide-binding protein